MCGYCEELKEIKEKIKHLEECGCCGHDMKAGDRVVKLRGGHKGCLGTVKSMPSCKTAFVLYDWMEDKEGSRGWRVRVSDLLKIR